MTFGYADQSILGTVDRFGTRVLVGRGSIWCSRNEASESGGDIITLGQGYGLAYVVQMMGLDEVADVALRGEVKHSQSKVHNQF